MKLYSIMLDKDYISEACTGETHLRIPMSDPANEKYYIPTNLEINELNGQAKVESDVWDFVKTLIKMDRSDFYRIFGDDSIDCITEMTYLEAKIAYDKWKKNKKSAEDVKIGDEVINFRGEKYIVYQKEKDSLYGINLSCYPPKCDCFGSGFVNTTGRSFPIFAETLAKIKEKE